MGTKKRNTPVRPRKRRSAGKIVRVLSGVSGLLVVPACVLIGSILLLAGGWLLHRDYFRSNRNMRLSYLKVDAGPSISPALVREWVGLREGVGLFDVDISAVRNRLVAEAPQVKDIEISRILPDTMHLRVVGRQPLVRLGRDGRLVADEEGLIFVWQGGLDILPCLVGGDRHTGRIGRDGIVIGGERRQIHPGSLLGGMGRAALRVLSLVENPAWRLQVMEVDVSAADHLKLLLRDRREILLAWEGMREDSERSLDRLKRRMSSLLQVLSDPASRDCRFFDATVDDQRIIGRMG